MRRDRSLTCPRCAASFSSESFRDDAILRPRASSAGGPYYESVCTACETPLALTHSARGWTAIVRDSTWFDRWATRFARPPDEPTDDDASGPPRDDDADAAARDAHRRAEEAARAHRRAHARREPPPDPDPEPSDLGDLADCLALLGVEDSSDAATIRAAFRERSKLFHPDRFVHLDADFQRLAHEKFIQLQRARDRLLAERER